MNLKLIFMKSFIKFILHSKCSLLPIELISNDTFNLMMIYFSYVAHETIKGREINIKTE